MIKTAALSAAIALLVSACAGIPGVPSASPQARAEIAPGGKLRAAINFGNPILAVKDPATDEPRGLSVDLARELGRSLGLPVELVIYTAAGKVVEGLRAGEWDIAFVAIDPARGRHGLQRALCDHRGRLSGAAGFNDQTQ